MQKYRRKHNLDEILLHEAKISLMRTRRILHFSNQKAIYKKAQIATNTDM